jgi:large subunit ribosomal protein L4
MKVDVLDLKGTKIREMELPANIFEATINVDLMHQAYVRQMAGARLGTHQTKVRSEVRGGGRKPFKQKGTGRARQGSTNAAQWVGGGRIHTPHPRSYEQRMPKKMRLAALRSVLSVKAAESGIVVVDDFDIKEMKTRLMVETLVNWVGESTALVLMPAKDQNYDNVVRSAGNIESAKILLASYLNVRDVLSFQKVIMPLKTIDALVAHLG